MANIHCSKKNCKYYCRTLFYGGICALTTVTINKNGKCLSKENKE